jgi:hypothetical protein
LNETLQALIELRNEDRFHLEHTRRSVVGASQSHMERAKLAQIQHRDVEPLIGAAVLAGHEARLLQGRLKVLDTRLRSLLSLHELTLCCARSARVRRSPQLREWLNAIAEYQCGTAFPPKPDPLGDELEFARLRDELLQGVQGQPAADFGIRGSGRSSKLGALARVRRRRVVDRQRTGRLRRRVMGIVAALGVTLGLASAAQHWVQLRRAEDNERLVLLQSEIKSSSPEATALALPRWEVELELLHGSQATNRATVWLRGAKFRLLQHRETECRERVAAEVLRGRLLEALRVLDNFVSRTADLGSSRWAAGKRRALEQLVSARRWGRLLADLGKATSDGQRRDLLESYVSECPPPLMHRAASKELRAVISRLDEVAYAEIESAPYESREDVAHLLARLLEYRSRFPRGRYRSEIKKITASTRAYEAVLQEASRNTPSLARLHNLIRRALAANCGRFESVLKKTAERWSRVSVQLRLGALVLYDASESWADLFSLPDLELAIYSGGERVHMSHAGSDSGVLNCGYTVAFVHQYGSSLRFAVFDEDVTESEWIADLSVVDLGQLNGSISGAQFRVNVQLTSVEPAGGP